MPQPSKESRRERLSLRECALLLRAVGLDAEEQPGELPAVAPPQAASYCSCCWSSMLEGGEMRLGCCCCWMATRAKGEGGGALLPAVQEEEAAALLLVLGLPLLR